MPRLFCFADVNRHFILHPGVGILHYSYVCAGLAECYSTLQPYSGGVSSTHPTISFVAYAPSTVSAVPTKDGTQEKHSRGGAGGPVESTRHGARGGFLRTFNAGIRSLIGAILIPAN